MKVGFSHGDTIEFLLESECQCSFEVCLHLSPGFYGHLSKITCHNIFLYSDHPLSCANSV